MEQIVSCLSMEQKFTNSKQKILKLYRVHYVKEAFQKIGQQITRKKKAGFNGYVYNFSVDYDSTDVDDIKEIYKYLMKKKRHNVNENVWIC